MLPVQKRKGDKEEMLCQRKKDINGAERSSLDRGLDARQLMLKNIIKSDRTSRVALSILSTALLCQDSKLLDPLLKTCVRALVARTALFCAGVTIVIKFLASHPALDSTALQTLLLAR